MIHESNCEDYSLLHKSQVSLSKHDILDPAKQLPIYLVNTRQNNPMIPIKLAKRDVMVLEGTGRKHIVALLREADVVVFGSTKKYRRRCGGEPAVFRDSWNCLETNICQRNQGSESYFRYCPWLPSW
jgi:hypothetical protein